MLMLLGIRISLDDLDVDTKIRPVWATACRIKVNWVAGHLIRRFNMQHPHPDKQHVIRQVRRYLLSAKKRFGTARGLVHYNDLIATYLTVKKEVVNG